MCYTGNKAIHVWDNMGWITLFPTEFLLYIWHLSKVAGGRIRSWLTLSCLWSWVLPWSRPRPPAKCAPPTCPTRSCGATSSPPSSPSHPPESMSLIFPSLTRLPRPRLRLFLNKPRLQTPSRPNNKAIVLETKEWIRRRCDWRRATGMKEGGAGGVSENSSASASVTSRERKTEMNEWTGHQINCLSSCLIQC